MARLLPRSASRPRPCRKVSPALSSHATAECPLGPCASATHAEAMWPKQPRKPSCNCSGSFGHWKRDSLWAVNSCELGSQTLGELSWKMPTGFSQDQPTRRRTRFAGQQWRRELPTCWRVRNPENLFSDRASFVDEMDWINRTHEFIISTRPHNKKKNKNEDEVEAVLCSGKLSRRCASKR